MPPRGYMPAAWTAAEVQPNSEEIWIGCGIDGASPAEGTLDELRMDSATYTTAQLQALSQTAAPFSG